jgi:CTP:molybdopterin cytidylyltransferase MocA
MSLGADGAAVADQLQSGTLPEVSLLPEAVRVIVEDIYAQGIASSFLIAVPLAVISLIAIVFLPNKPLTRMTTSERLAAGEADLATVTTAEGMSALEATGSAPTVTDATTAEAAAAGASRRGR